MYCKPAVSGTALITVCTQIDLIAVISGSTRQQARSALTACVCVHVYIKKPVCITIQIQSQYCMKTNQECVPTSKLVFTLLFIVYDLEMSEHYPRSLAV